MKIITKIRAYLEGLRNQELNSKKLLKLSIGIVVVFLIIICPVLNFFNLFSDTLIGHFFVIKAGVSDWFSFWGSFSGTLATIFVGLATFRLTERIEEKHREAEELQKKMTIIQNIPNMYCVCASLYSYNNGDYLDEHISKFPKMNNFCIYLKMACAFPAYFKVTISQMQLNRKLDKEHTIDLENKDYSITNHRLFELYINVPKSMETVVRDLYDSNLKTTNVTSDEEKKFSMGLRLRCDNILLPQINGDVEFWLSFDLKNMKRTEPPDSRIILQATNIKFLETSNN